LNKKNKAEEKFQKETIQPFKEEKMKTRLPIMETPIIKKIVEMFGTFK
jgi:hypothetical protein